MEKKKVSFIFCVCTGKCPGFKDLDMWDFINIIRAEYPVEYAFIHPMLCDEDGERFFADFLRKDRALCHRRMRSGNAEETVSRRLCKGWA